MAEDPVRQWPTIKRIGFSGKLSWLDCAQEFPANNRAAAMPDAPSFCKNRMNFSIGVTLATGITGEDSVASARVKYIRNVHNNANNIFFIFCVLKRFKVRFWVIGDRWSLAVRPASRQLHENLLTPSGFRRNLAQENLTAKRSPLGNINPAAFARRFGSRVEVSGMTCEARTACFGFRLWKFAPTGITTFPTCHADQSTSRRPDNCFTGQFTGLQFSGQQRLPADPEGKAGIRPRQPSG